MNSIKNDHDYEKIFKKEKHNDIFEISNDTRKFEIDLYWKRSNYFILFIGATLTAYLAVYGTIPNEKDLILYLLNCIGIISTWTWFLSLKGSKYWQNNWENHIEFNQKLKVGPLFEYVYVVEKVKYPPGKIITEIADKITKESPYSVSKLNMLLSIFILIIWVVLLFFVSNVSIYNALSDWNNVKVSNFTIKTLLFVITILYFIFMAQYGSSSFKKEMLKYSSSGTKFFKLKR